MYGADYFLFQLKTEAGRHRLPRLETNFQHMYLCTCLLAYLFTYVLIFVRTDLL